ncbi:MAG: shikimate kinase [Candidatus Omnitrophota bacterium]
MKNIILVGFMGTGKTSVGQELAKKLKMRFVDMDDLIEEREGMKISDIFAKKGEAHFRQVEKETAKHISTQSNLVVGAGGGAVIDEENVKNFKSSGIVICLAASVDRILERTNGYSHRPLLNVSDPKEKISKLLAKRAQYYARADYRVDTSDLSIKGAVERILELIK